MKPFVDATFASAKKGALKSVEVLHVLDDADNGHGRVVVARRSRERELAAQRCRFVEIGLREGLRHDRDGWRRHRVVRVEGAAGDEGHWHHAEEVPADPREVRERPLLLPVDLTDAQQREKTLSYMATMPAWKAHPKVRKSVS